VVSRGFAPLPLEALFYVVSSAAEGGGRNKKNLKLTPLFLYLCKKLIDIFFWIRYNRIGET